MVRMVNRLTGGDMWVDDSRVAEYRAAGHKLAALPAPAKPVKQDEKKTRKESTR